MARKVARANKTSSKQWAGKQPSIFEDKYCWLDIKSALLGLDDLFGTYEELLDSVREGCHLKKAPDPIKQFAAIKLLNQDTFLWPKTTDLKPKRQVLCWAMYSAARFAISGNLQEVTTKNIPPPETNRQLLQSLRHRMSVYVNMDAPDLPIIIDSGASVSLTPNPHDFIGPIRACSTTEMSGLQHTTSVSGMGTVEWSIRDYFGVVRTIRTSAFYVPDATIRLFSPQAYFQENDARRCVIEAKKTTLKLADGSKLELPYNCGSNLPLMLPSQHTCMGHTFSDVAALTKEEIVSSFLSVAQEINHNLTRHLALEPRARALWLD